MYVIVGRFAQKEIEWATRNNKKFSDWKEIRGKYSYHISPKYQTWAGVMEFISYCEKYPDLVLILKVKKKVFHKFGCMSSWEWEDIPYPFEENPQE